MKDSVIVRVPASTSNLGPGFDTLGIALRLYNHVRVTRVSGKGIDLVSEISEGARGGALQMIREAARSFFRLTHRAEFAIDVLMFGDVPVARGLGSSVTVRLGVVAGLNALTGKKLSRPQLLEIVAALEHHPDNAAPALFGGFCAAGMDATSVRCLHFPVGKNVKFVALIPNFEISTEKARQLVPQKFSKADTIHNLNRAALISAGFASGQVEALRGLFEDRVHQPYRQKLIPPLSRVIRAGVKAGAIGGWLSGSGSTIICLTLKNAEAVGRAMRKQLRDSAIQILAADNDGLVVR
jgi:homoserine kinase